MSTVSCWLIERPVVGRAHPEYFTGEAWMSDPWQALRFQTRASARAAIRTFDFPDAKAVSHGFMVKADGQERVAAWRQRFEVGVILLALAASVLSVLRGDAFAAATSACLFGALSAQIATRTESPIKKLALALLHARNENLYPRLPRFVRRWVYTRTMA